MTTMRKFFVEIVEFCEEFGEMFPDHMAARHEAEVR